MAFSQEEGKTLAGSLLLAMPGMGGPHFDHTVLYLHEHNEQGAMGFVINQPAEDITLSDIVESLKLPQAEMAPNAPVFIGGPVDTGRGFVLHDGAYQGQSTATSANEQIGVTATLDVLEMLCSPSRIANALTILGYSGWSANQLEQELQENAWLVCPFNADLIFSITPERKYEAGMALMGIDLAKLSSDSGSA